MLASWLEVRGVRLPRVLLGTSPFIGAGQFGTRALAYQAAFYNRPDRVAEIIAASYELGVRGVQALPYAFLAEAIKMAQAEIGEELPLVITVGPDQPLADLRLFDGLDVRAALLHGSLSDSAPADELGQLLDAIRDHGFLAGYVTHAPMSLLRLLLANELPRPDLILLPFNARGYLMDAPAQEIAKAVRALGVPAIGKKVLAAGRLRPADAFRFALSFRVLEGMAIGVTSRAEAEETFRALADALREIGWPSERGEAGS